MLISCASCFSKYLVNSSDLKPDGRMVKCAHCGNQWYQENLAKNQEGESLKFESSIIQNKQPRIKASNSSIPNLPVTYIKEQKVSFFNSLAILLIVPALIFCFWTFKKIEMNTFVLLKYYVDEFYFNLQLIIQDIANLIYKIIN